MVKVILRVAPNSFHSKQGIINTSSFSEHWSTWGLFKIAEQRASILKLNDEDIQMDYVSIP